MEHEEELIKHACSTNDLEILEILFIRYGYDSAKSLVLGMECAIEHNHTDIIDFIVTHCNILDHACKVGSLQVLKFFSKDLKELINLRKIFKNNPICT